MDGLLLSGGSDISPEFLRQDVPDPSVLDKQIDPERDRWEFQAVQNALSRGLPILAICKGLQVFNVALGGTLKLDIQGHNLPDQKHRDVQPLRSARGASHRFPKVNSAHHQAIDQLGDDLEVEAWAAHDGIIEQVRLRKYPFGLAVQYHPERSRLYDSLFDDFFARLESTKTVTLQLNRSQQVTSLRATQNRNSPKGHREQRRDDCASTQQHECGTVRAEAILHCTDDCRTDKAAHVRDCYHQGNPRGCRCSGEEPRRHRPKWTIGRAVSDRNQRQKKQRQNWLP